MRYKAVLPFITGVSSGRIHLFRSLIWAVSTAGSHVIYALAGDDMGSSRVNCGTIEIPVLTPYFVLSLLQLSGYRHAPLYF